MPYFKNADVDVNLLFIHIPKTGGTSLEHYFSHKYAIPLNNESIYLFWQNNEYKITSSLQHITYQTMLQYKTELNIDFNHIQILTVVRNPYERLVSDLFFNKLIDIDTSKEEAFNIICEYLTRSDLDNHNIPQYKFIINNVDEDNTLIDVVILHTETLISDMHNLGYTDFNIHANVNKHTDINYYDYLNSDSIKIINEFYDKDFSLFNYTKMDV